VSSAAFGQAASLLTTEATQFMIEAVGYANHVGVVCRLQAVVEMRFETVPQYLYYRDVSSLGVGYPVHWALMEPEERERATVRHVQRAQHRER
jgi:hypothetical protein